MKKSKNSRSNFTIFLSGTLLLILAAVLFFQPFENDLTNFYLIGAVFIMAGLLDILAFAQNHRWYFRPGWMLQQSFFMIFFGGILIFSVDIELDSDILLFSFMAFFTAATQLACCIQLHALEIRRWWWISIFGLVNIVFGVYFLINPLAEYIGIFVSAALFIFVTGIIAMMEPFVYVKGKKREEGVN